MGTGWSFEWSVGNPNIGLPLSGLGDINFIAQNPGNTPLFSALFITPYQGICQGDDITTWILVNPTPTITPVPDLTVCPNAPVNIPFSGTSGATFSWTNTNPAIGLPAAGSGDISFTAAQVATPQTGTVTVTPLYDDCPGDPVVFNITVDATFVEDPPDITVCPGEAVSVPFSGNGTSYTWTNTNPGIGLGAAGSGNLSFTAAGGPAQQTGTITVTPQGGACPPQTQNFTVTVLPLPAVAQPPDVSACEGEAVAVNFTGSPGAVFTWTNDNPAIGLAPSGSGPIAFNAPPVGQSETATITVTPVRDPCAGAPRTFRITVNPRPVLTPLPDRNVCTGDTVQVAFSATLGALVYWNNTNPGIGLATDGVGDIGFTAAALPASPQTGLITALPYDGLCYGNPQSFEITAMKCCETFAGNMDTAAVYACGEQPVPVVFLYNDSLETNDTLRFILFTNPGNPLGSIVYETDTLYFPFVPGVTAPDSVYYVAAVAGNKIGADSIDRADPCLDISNPQRVRWAHKPAIGAVPAPREVCAGECLAVELLFTGAPPFSFTWRATEDGAAVLHERTETAAQSPYLLLVCPDAFDVPYGGGVLGFGVIWWGDKWCGCMD